MVSIAGITVPIPTTVGGAVGFLVNALLAFAVILVIDKLISHDIDVKHSFIMAIGAYFISPIVFSMVAKLGIIPVAITTYIIPLIVWIVLGEILLEETDAKDKAVVAIVAFTVYTILTLINVPTMISQIFSF